MRRLICVALVAGLAACSPPAEKADAPPPPAPATTTQTEGAQLDGVTANARLTSPASITGVAPKNWYFEAVFPVMLVGADGRVIAEGPAQAQSDWTAPGNEPIRFRADLTFTITQDTPATLVLQEDMPGEQNPQARETRIPVVLAPR